jgi:hypothetical protein
MLGTTQNTPKNFVGERESFSKFLVIIGENWVQPVEGG